MVKIFIFCFVMFSDVCRLKQRRGRLGFFPFIICVTTEFIDKSNKPPAKFSKRVRKLEPVSREPGSNFFENHSFTYLKDCPLDSRNTSESNYKIMY